MQGRSAAPPSLLTPVNGKALPGRPASKRRKRLKRLVRSPCFAADGEVECDMPEKKDSYPATTPDPKPDVTNQQVVQVLLDLLKEARQRASTAATAELPPEVARDVAIANAEFALIENGLKMQAPFGTLSISPAQGSRNGGTAVTITGANFIPPATVSFDNERASRPASNVTVVSTSEIRATTPPRGEGSDIVDVVVTTFGGTARRIGGFSYIP
jgi:hypothetical protein